MDAFTLAPFLELSPLESEARYAAGLGEKAAVQSQES